MASLCRQNFREESEACLNRFINLKLLASYTYQSLQVYFDRDDVAFPGSRGFYEQMSRMKRRQVDLLNEYQNKRGGRIILKQVQKPSKDSWGTPAEAMKEALKLEKEINQEALNLHSLAKKNGDTHLEDFMEEHFLMSEVDLLKNLSDELTKKQRVGPGLGEYLLDRHSVKN